MQSTVYFETIKAMTDEQIPQSTAEVVEQLEEEEIDLKVVRWAAGELQPDAEQKRWLEQLRSERGEDFYNDLIFALLGRRYPKSESHVLWNELVAHCETLTQALGRNPGIVVAAVDYLTNCREGKTAEFRLIENDKLEDMLERAVVDGLTGLYDHDTLLTLLEKEIERATRHAEKLALLLMDLDDFKAINDRFGHQKGDDVLAGMADVIRDTIRTMDIAGRYGGEEFAIILPETDPSDAAQSAERIRKSVKERFYRDPRLTVSIGVACFPGHGLDGAALVRVADEALYRAKAEGKNRVVTG